MDVQKIRYLKPCSRRLIITSSVSLFSCFLTAMKIYNSSPYNSSPVLTALSFESFGKIHYLGGPELSEENI